MISLQRCAFGVFQWANKQLAADSFDAEAFARAISHHAGARTWISGQMSHVPRELRVDKADLDPFSKLFASFLHVSYELHPAGYGHAICSCGAGARFEKAHFKPRGSSPELRKEAESLRMGVIRALGGGGQQRKSADTLDLSLVAYARQLVRCARVGKRSPASLVLFRHLRSRGRHQFCADDVAAALRTVQRHTS